MARVVVKAGGSRAVINEIGERWADEAGPALVKSARGFAGIWTGLLRQSMEFDRVYKGGQFESIRFGSHVEYAALHHEGRGPVFPVHAKVLRWIDKMTGDVVFRRSAGPAKANPYLYLALKALGLKRARRTS
jgi:hypothetical protein